MKTIGTSSISTSARLAALLAAVAVATTAHADPSLLHPISLPGTSSSVVWTNLSNTNPTFVPASGSGSFSVQPPGFRASAGLYSFSGNYAFTAGSSTGLFDIATVTLQYVGGQNPNFTLAQYLALGGGPALTYTTDLGTGTVSPMLSGILAGPSGGTGPLGPVNFYTFAWQWDLSSIVGTLSSFSIANAVPIHTSVTGARLDFGDTFATAVPEPSVAAALLAMGALAFAARRRR